MKKLLIFLMIAIPLIIIVVVNLTVNVVTGYVAIAVERISLEPHRIEAKIDTSETLSATILPTNATNQQIIWSSTNESVAQVDLNGRVKFIDFGECYIIATTVDGGKTASCFVFVTDTTVHDVTLDSDYSEMGNYYVAVNETLQLKTDIRPTGALNHNVYYSSSNEEIATVDGNGLVTAGSVPGAVTITATSEENEDISDSILVRVVNPVEEIKLDGDKEVFTSTNSYKLKYSVYPENVTVKEAVFASSDEDIATVTPAGEVQFKKPGTVTVTVKSMQGGHTDSVKVTYTNGYAEDIILDAEMLNVSASINDGGMYIQYTTVPANITVPVVFECDDENIAYVDESGYVQFFAGGQVTITVKAEKAPGVYVEKYINLYIASPATDILIDDVIYTAQRSVKLEPKSSPLTSTNTSYFFESLDESVATVDQDGVVTFNENKFEARIQIFANPEKDVSKTVRVVYTNGYPTQLIVEKTNYEINYGEFDKIEYLSLPSGVTKTPEFRVVSQTNNSGEGEVVRLLSDGTIMAIGGGTAEIEVSILKAENGEKLLQTVFVTVIRKVEDIGFIATNLTDDDLVGDEYLTGQPTVNVLLENRTLDATNQTISWRVLSSNAVKSDENTLSFNSPGAAEIELFSQDGFTKTVRVNYYKDKIYSFELEETPESIDYDQTFEFKIAKTIPSNASKKIVIKISNQITSNPTGIVLTADGSTVKAVAGGSALVTVQVLNEIKTIEIRSIRKVEDINITPSNIQTTSNRVVLSASVLPEDSTNKQVAYSTTNTDIATLEDNVLIFKKDGIVTITARALDGSNVTKEFTIEKIAKGTGDVQVTDEPIIMNIGDSNILTMSTDFTYTSKQLQIKNQTTSSEGDVIRIDNDIVYALNIGEATIECILSDDFGQEKTIEIMIIVVPLTEDIEMASDLDKMPGLDEYLTAEGEVELKFNLVPSYTSSNYTTDNKYSVSIVSFDAQDPTTYRAPYMIDSKLVFSVPGTATIRVTSDDKNVTKDFKINYTGGGALSAELNISDELVLAIGESKEIEVVRWIPSNATNKNIRLELVSSSNKAIEINGTTITARSGGRNQVTVFLSSGLRKQITVIVQTKVEQIVIDDEIITTEKTVTLNPSVRPSTATNPALSYALKDTDIANINGAIITFDKPGTVEVTIKAVDGSDVTKLVKVTSTWGFAAKIEINAEERNMQKGNTFGLAVKSWIPSNATLGEVNYEIIESNAADGSNNAVISIKKNAGGDATITAIYAGTAKVRVYVEDYYGNRVYKDATFSVFSPATAIDVTFTKSLQLNNGSYVFGEDTLGFNVTISPEDANSEFTTTILRGSAEIEGNEIKFVKVGVVVIRFAAADNESLYKDYSFYYTANQMLKAELDTNGMTDYTIGLKAGEEFEFKLNSYLPSDIKTFNFRYVTQSETRIDRSKGVLRFDGNKIYALNGGTVVFDIYVNELKLISGFTVTVYRDASEIYTNKNEYFINLKTNQVAIEAKAMPSDTYQTGLKYEVVSGNASVEQNGIVTMTENGTAIIKISVENNPSVFKQVNVTYSNSVRAISFITEQDRVDAGENLYLKVNVEPFGIENYEILYESDREDIASVHAVENDKLQVRVYAKPGQKGIVKIKATVKGTNISCEKEITVNEVLQSFQIIPEMTENNRGIGNYRVYGNQTLTTINGAKTKINTFQMKVGERIPANNTSTIVWDVYDQNPENPVLTIDKYSGLVTFNRPGTATVYACPEGKETPRSQYTFNVVDGVNVYNFEDFLTVVNEKQFNIVLQDNIAQSSKVNLYKSLYGNGYTIDMSSYGGDEHKIEIKASNLIVDNVEIIGKNLGTDNPALSTLANTGTILSVFPDGDEHLTNVTVRNTLIKNLFMGVCVRNSDVKFTGCVIMNTLSAGLNIRRNTNPANQNPPHVIVEDCVFAKNLFGCVLFEPEQPTDAHPNNISKLEIQGTLKMYNYLKADEFNIDFIKDYVPDAGEQIANILKMKGSQYVKKVNGDDYILLGIVSVHAKATDSFVGAISLEFNSYGKTRFIDETPYKYASVQGIINAKGTLINIASADATLNCYTLEAGSNYINPTDTYTVYDNDLIRKDLNSLYKSIEGLTQK